jgi:hypothetical protein
VRLSGSPFKPGSRPPTYVRGKLAASRGERSD